MLSHLRQLKNLTLTLLPASPRPIFRPFCSDASGILWRYRAERGGHQWRLMKLIGLRIKFSNGMWTTDFWLAMHWSPAKILYSTLKNNNSEHSKMKGPCQQYVLAQYKMMRKFSKTE